MEAPLADFDFSFTELDAVYCFIVNSLAFYDDKTVRKSQLAHLSSLVHHDVLRTVELPTAASYLNHDGITFSETCRSLSIYHKAATSFTEIKNGIGEGESDPIHQGQCDCVAYYSSDHVRCSARPI